LLHPPFARRTPTWLPARGKREPGPILRILSRAHGVWVPACAGTTTQESRPMHFSLAMLLQQPIDELGCDAQQCLRGFAVRRVPHARQERHLHGAITLFTRHFDLLCGAVLV